MAPKLDPQAFKALDRRRSAVYLLLRDASWLRIAEEEPYDIECVDPSTWLF